jgi:hypothetical protein
MLLSSDRPIHFFLNDGIKSEMSMYQNLFTALFFLTLFGLIQPRAIDGNKGADIKRGLAMELAPAVAG